MIEENTLEPPGKIVVLGGEPLGIEVTLYGRYLGFHVSLFAAGEIQQQILHAFDHIPERPCSPLGLAALAAQQGHPGTKAEIEFDNLAGWFSEYFAPLASSDLLRDSLFYRRVVTGIELVDVASDDQDEDADDDPVPPDFLIAWRDEQGGVGEESFECVIDTRGAAVRADVAWLGPGKSKPQMLPDYYLEIDPTPVKNDDGRITDVGWQRIRDLFAGLCGRKNLDVYRNLGGED
jgi:hypothetical protein